MKYRSSNQLPKEISILQDRDDCDRSQWRAQQSAEFKNVASQCLSVAVFYTHRAGASSLRVFHQIGLVTSSLVTSYPTSGRMLLRVRLSGFE
jgi:hypothetical protein